MLVATQGWTQDAPPGTQADALRRLEELEKEVSTLRKQVESDKNQTADSSAERPDFPNVDMSSRGLTVTSPDEAFQLRLRLRMAMDTGFVLGEDSDLEDAFGSQDNGVDFRAIRLTLQGYAWNDFKYQAEIDFAGQNGEDTPKFRDVYVEYDKVPYGGDRKLALRFGHYKEPFNLDELNSFFDRTFMENPLLDVFVPSRNVGIQASDALFGEPRKERMTWAIGAFTDTDDWPSSNDSDDSEGWAITTRVTGLPWYAQDGRRLLHLGFGYSHRDSDGTLDYRTRTESRLVSARYVDPNLSAIDDADLSPGVIRLNDADVNSVDLFNAEIAGVVGPFWWQAEYLHSLVDTELEDTLGFFGYYMQAGYILTGEHRPYQHDRGTFGSPKPKRNFNPFSSDGGWGAWEVAARHSYVDMDDGAIRGGNQSAITLGLNWYLNPNVRIALNAIHNDVETDFYDGTFEVIQTRLQFTF